MLTKRKAAGDGHPLITELKCNILKLDQPYKNIQDTLEWMYIQILEGIPWAVENLPRFENPEQLFYWFKNRTWFKKDPYAVELLQTLPTLMTSENWHGSPGHGDCDCFTIALATATLAQGWPTYIILVGRSKRYPVHIYNGVEWDGEMQILDLTNTYFDQERTGYKYIQELPVRI